MARSVSFANNSAHIAYAGSGCEDQYDWDDAVADFRSEMAQAFPSLSECDEWVGREDHALLENRYAYFGVSEYCGLVSMWVQPKEPDYYSSPGFEGLRDCWIEAIGPKFMKTAASCFGLALKQVGRFSNGEAVFMAA